MPESVKQRQKSNEVMAYTKFFPTANVFKTTIKMRKIFYYIPEYTLKFGTGIRMALGFSAWQPNFYQQDFIWNPMFGLIMPNIAQR